MNVEQVGITFKVTVTVSDGSVFNFDVIAKNEVEAHATLRKLLLECAEQLKPNA
jgi:2-polyprenyl-3-methyl-5-hydroxy-6-metoxy-1,4-benzoquinol methylase